MKFLRYIIGRPLLLPFLVLIITACSDTASNSASESVAEAMPDRPAEHAAKHADPKYICPMHPQIVQDEPGSCPICGMDLVAKEIEPTPAAAALPTIASASTPAASESVAEAMQDSPAEHAAKHADPRYICPMHPQIVQDEPGSCPICGMDLVRKEIEAQPRKQPVVSISNAVIQTMGVRTEPAIIDNLTTKIRAVGRIDYDETRLTHIHPRASGWMEKLHLRAEGDPVKKGQLLGELYSPEILSAQVDYLIALDQSSDLKMEKARNGLRLLGVADSTIKRIEKSGETLNTVPLYAPSSGVITLLTAREGMYVQPQMEIFTIAELSKIWVLVDIFEHQIDWLKLGASAEISVPAYPGKTWLGKVDYIYPEMDPDSRTLKVRLAFDNPDSLLKANMFAEVSIDGQQREQAVVIPSPALIETGERSSVVVALGDGRFQPVDVITGIRSNGYVEILSGVQAGERVVVSGQFLIDSESSLQASFMRMLEGE